MATIGIRESALAGITANRRAILQRLCEFLEIRHAVAPRYVGPGGIVWRVYDDHRFTLLDAAVLGTVVRLVAQMPDDAEYTRAQVLNAIQNQIVLPRDVVIPEGADPFATVLAAQNAPAAVRMVTELPETFQPAETET